MGLDDGSNIVKCMDSVAHPKLKFVVNKRLNSPSINYLWCRCHPFEDFVQKMIFVSFCFFIVKAFTEHFEVLRDWVNQTN